MVESYDFLQGMRRLSVVRCDVARARESREKLRARALHSATPTPLSLSSSGFDVMAEVKFSSVHQRFLRDGDDPIVRLDQRVETYVTAGAAAISVLTEPSRFAGSLEHLRRASEIAASRCPEMRKDFLVSDYQVYEARAMGASGVLLILRMLDTATLTRMLEAAAECDLFVLLEAFDERELLFGEDVAKRAPKSNLHEHPILLGLNCRDLTTLEVCPDRLFAPELTISESVPTVAESGLLPQESDAQRLAQKGYRMALMGSALMSEDDPLSALSGFIETTRRAVKGMSCESA